MVSNATCGAGATLKVTAAGVISSSCTQTEVSKNHAAKNVNSFSSYNDLNFYFPATSSNDAVLTISTLDGQKICSFIKKSNTPENVKLNIRRLLPGIYFVKMQDNNVVTACKFLKKQ
jgi:pectate lyase